MNRSIHSILTVTAVVALSMVNGARCDELPDELKQGVSRIDALVSPLEIKWVRHRLSEIPIRELLQRLNLDQADPAFLEPMECEYVYDHGKVFARVVESKSSFDANGGFLAIVTEPASFAFDGTVLYSWSGESRSVRNAILFRDTLDSLLKDSHADAIMFQAALFAYIGLHMPNRVGDFGSAGQSILKSPRLLLRESRRDGPLWEVHLAEPTTADEHVYWLRPDWGYLAERYEFRPHRKELLGEVATASDYKMIPDTEFGLPRHVSVAFIRDGDELYRESYDVVELNKAPVKEDRFVITDLRPGVTIADGTLPEASARPGGRITYVVPARSEDLEKAIEAAKRGQKFDSPMTPENNTGSRLRQWLIAVNLVVVILLVAIFSWRRLRRT